MRRIVLLFALVGLAGLSFTNPALVSVAQKVDTAKSTVTWKGYKVTGQHSGTIALKDGSLAFNNGVLTGGSFEIDMTSIKCTDLTGGTAQKLEGHLKSADFFGVEKFPTAKFEITKVYPKGTPGDYKILGNLTIKESTEEIKFYATVKDTDGGMTANADITIDRTDYDVRYRSGGFFENLGDKTIYDEFDLSISLVTAK